MEIEKRWIASKDLFDMILEMLAEEKKAGFTVTGMSMWPLLCHGRDQVVVEKVNPKSVKYGDIVLIRCTENKYLLHRVTKVMADSVETTGDGNCFRDGIFPKECIVARVDSIIRKGKKIECSEVPLRVSTYIWMSLFPWRKKIFDAWFCLRKYIR